MQYYDCDAVTLCINKKLYYYFFDFFTSQFLQLFTSKSSHLF